MIHSIDYCCICDYIDAKISGSTFLRLKEDSLEQYGLSTGSQIPLMKIIEEVVSNLNACLFNVSFEYYVCTVEKVPTIS